VSDNLDNGQSITSFIETKTHIDFSETASGLNKKRIAFGEVTLEHIHGDVNLKVYWAGTRGRYKILGEWNLKADEGSLKANIASSTMSTYSAQQRLLRTPAIQRFEDASDCTSRGIESTHDDWVDIGFSLLIVWTGHAALRSYRIFADPFDETATGEKAFDETGTKILPTGTC
jgi:hypothetical protein